MAFIDESGKWIGPGPDPRTATAGATYQTPAQFNPNLMPTISIPSGYSQRDWTNLIQGNSNYMGFKLSAAQRADQAAAQRKAALQALAVRYGGLPAGFKDVYGDLTPDIQDVAKSNPLSQSATLGRDYGQSQENYKRGLAARGALQSGDLGYGLDQLDVQHSGDLYNMGNDFLSAAQGAVNGYASTLSGINQEQIDAIRQAAQDVYGQGYRLGFGGAGGQGAGDGSWGPSQYSNFIQSFAPQGQTYDQMANNGQPFAFTGSEGWGNPYGVQPGQQVIAVKYLDPVTGHGNTIVVPYDSSAVSTNPSAAPPPPTTVVPADQPVVQAPTVAPSVTVGGNVSPTDLINSYIAGRRGTAGV